MTRPLAAALACALVLAGCIGPDDALEPAARGPQDLEALSTPIHDALVRHEAVVAGADDVRVWLDVYRPDAPADVKVPVILVMTPYQSLGDVFSATAAAGGACPGPRPQDCPYDADLVDFFVPRGYAVAFADVRGNHNAGGCTDQSGPKQWEDGFRVVEWLGTQDWSNGNVGMVGVSYDGETQTTTAILQPPHLKTIVPIASVRSQYDYVYFEGVPYELQGLGTMAGYAAISAVPGQDPAALPHYPERFTCPEENMRAGLDLTGDMTPYWAERDYRPYAGEITASVLLVHGLADWNVKPIHVDEWFNAFENAAARRAILGQWNHNWPQRGDWWDQGGILHRWMDHFLLGIDTGLLGELPPVLIQADPGTCGEPSAWRCRSEEGAWRGIPDFPPRAQAWTTFELGVDGTLTTAPGAPGELALYDAPRDQAALGVALRPVDDGADAAARAAMGLPSRLVFESSVLAAPLHVTGVPYLAFSATTDASSTHWSALLEIVRDDGSSEWINRGYQDTRHLAGLDAPSDLTPGEPYDVRLRMFPQDDGVPAGVKLRLTLQNQDEWVHQDTTFATSGVAVGAGAAVLHLPLDPGGAAFAADRLRP